MNADCHPAGLSTTWLSTQAAGGWLIRAWNGNPTLFRAVQRAADVPSLGAFADALLVDPSTSGRLVDRGAAAGFLERRPSSDDLRMTRLYLTASGVRLLNEVTARRRKLFTGVTEGLPTQDVLHLTELLRELRRAFDDIEALA